jgi:hypothetical protein
VIVGRKLMTQMMSEADLQVAAYLRVLLLFSSVRDIVG